MNFSRKTLIMCSARELNIRDFSIVDRYLGHVDLMKFLVESNCGDIPSLRDLMHPDSARYEIREGRVYMHATT